MVHVLLKPGLENFEHYFASIWDECNCAVVWTFFGIAFLWDCNENWPFPVLWPLLNFQICWPIECSTFTASSFTIWNSSTGIPSPPLALFVVMLPKAHLTSHSRMSGSKCVITSSWLSGLWRPFLYSSSLYSCHFLISPTSVRSIWFLSFIVPILAWNVPLVSLIFLKKSLVFPILLLSTGYIEGYIQSLTLWAPNAEGLGSVPGRDEHATTKTQCSHIHNFFFNIQTFMESWKSQRTLGHKAEYVLSLQRKHYCFPIVRNPAGRECGTVRDPSWMPPHPPSAASEGSTVSSARRVSVWFCIFMSPRTIWIYW